MLETLKREVYEANLMLPKYNLVTFTWGNVSGIDRKSGLVAIKPSGVEYDTMKIEDIVILDLDGKVIEGKLKPSSDTPTHLQLYKRFENIGGIVHTHSRWATIFSQAGKEIKPYGTTQADYFNGEIPCTRNMKIQEIQKDYEHNTANVIIEKFEKIEKTPIEMPAILVKNHGPFAFGKDTKEAVHNAVVLEEIAMMAYNTEILAKYNIENMPDELLNKHFDRKHGKFAYYGQ